MLQIQMNYLNKGNEDPGLNLLLSIQLIVCFAIVHINSFQDQQLLNI